MIAQNIAMTRERFWWLASFGGLAYTGSFVAIMKKKFTPAAGGPLVVFTFLLAYTWDLAYGNKMARINSMMEDMIENEPHFFTPIYPTEDQLKHLKELETKHRD